MSEKQITTEDSNSQDVHDVGEKFVDFLERASNLPLLPLARLSMNLKIRGNLALISLGAKEKESQDVDSLAVLIQKDIGKSPNMAVIEKALGKEKGRQELRLHYAATIHTIYSMAGKRENENIRPDLIKLMKQLLFSINGDFFSDSKKPGSTWFTTLHRLIDLKADGKSIDAVLQKFVNGSSDIFE